MNTVVYKHLLHTYGRNPWQWVGLGAELVRLFIMRVYIVIAMAQVTSNIASGQLNDAKRYALYFFISYIAGALIGITGEFISLNTENRQYGKLMMEYYQKLIHKDVSFYRDHQTGYLASIYRQYLDSAMNLLRFLRGEALGTLISFVVPPIILLSASPMVGLISILVVIVQFVYVAWSSSKVNLYRKISHEVYRKVTGEVSDVITNIIAFKSGGIEERAYKIMASLSDQELEAFQKRRRAAVLYDLPRSIITACGITSAVYLIIIHTSGLNPESLGLMVLTITYMFQIVRNVGALPELITQHDDLVTKLHPTLRYLGNEYETIRDHPNPVPLNIQEGAICFGHVTFGYPSRSKTGAVIPVFNDFTMEIHGGEQVGIVGLSGAGKSTLANLLLRFDEIQGGSIKIDGIDIRDVRQSELRRSIAYVPQEPLLFHRTIRENISYYNDDVNESEIVRVAKAAHAHEFIEKMPDGYDTIVGERGIKLSGGQKQRVAIARALLKRAPIIVFDEATSALDSESEQIIQRALPEILGKQTAMIIAHRLSTVAGLHRIIVMHEGRVVECGTHDELLELKGRYYALWQKQTSEFATLA